MSGCYSVKGVGVFPGKATLGQPATLGLEGGGELPANQGRGEGRKSFSSRAPFTHGSGDRHVPPLTVHSTGQKKRGAGGSNAPVTLNPSPAPPPLPIIQHEPLITTEERSVGRSVGRSRSMHLFAESRSAVRKEEGGRKKRGKRHQTVALL